MPIPNPDSSQQILAAAKRTTFSRGVSALRMVDLAYDLGISTKTIYAHYPSKEVLLEAMMDAHCHHYGVLFQAVLHHPTMPFLERLQQSMRLGWEFNGEMSAEVTQDFRRYAPVLLKNLKQAQATTVQQHFRELLTEGLGQGMLRADLPLDAVIDILMETITYRLTPHNLQTKSYSLPVALNTFFQLLFTGLLSDTARQQFAHGWTEDKS